MDMQENLKRHQFGDFAKCMRFKYVWIQEKIQMRYA